ncbi:predicted protein [Naegleria gruberi]|uniref:Predicted protein n=1 Tax=Naegleria gruberi TaxID=5762 RepID=D2VNN4_NAEGR|nr:uncharacterized protein NAEGRDRAFT_51040 [Naegleria gruberi]EFC41439.1 predicted protein [Naegleria gruberi]|eukprot:XP_002674183.1 predicted protein [Naegleria gruberi strain NEG-M]
MVSTSKKKNSSSNTSLPNSPAISITSVESNDMNNSPSSLPSSPSNSSNFFSSSPNSKSPGRRLHFFPAKSPKKKSTTSISTDSLHAASNTNHGCDAIGDYTFSYEAVLDDEETRQCLLEYMRTIRCEESLLFLDQVNSFHRKRSTANRWSMIQSIFEQFFCEHSKYELNLPQRVKDMMIHTYSDVVEEIAHRKRMNLDEDTNSSSNSRSSLEQANQPPPQQQVKQNKNKNNNEKSNNNNRNSKDDLDVSLGSLDYIDLSDCEEALKKAESYILINLKEYVFPKFVGSDHFQGFISTKSKTFINTIGTVKALSHSCFVESLMDMRRCEINVDQVRMIKKHVFDTRYWDCIYQKETSYGFISSKKYILGEDDHAKGVYFAKCEVIFPYSADQIMNIMTNTKNRIEHDKNLEDIKRIGYRNKSGTTNFNPNLVHSSDEDEDTLSSTSSAMSDLHDTASSRSHTSNHSHQQTNHHSPISGKTKLATTLTHERYKLGWPIKSRYYLLAQSMVHDTTDNMYIIAKKSCRIPNYDPDEGTNIEAINIGCWMFQPLLDENQKPCCKYIQFVGTDLRGNIPTFIIEKIVRKRTSNFYKSTMKMIKACEEESTTRPFDSSGYFDTLDENGSMAL